MENLCINSALELNFFFFCLKSQNQGHQNVTSQLALLRLLEKSQLPRAGERPAVTYSEPWLFPGVKYGQ